MAIRAKGTSLQDCFRNYSRKKSFTVQAPVLKLEQGKAKLLDREIELKMIFSKLV